MEGLQRYFKVTPVYLNVAAKILAEKQTIESDASQQDQEALEQYLQWCTQDPETYKKTGADDKRPGIFVNKLLNTTAKYDIKKDYEMKFRNTLNKYSANELESLETDLKKIMAEAFAQFEKAEDKDQNLLTVFKIFALELYDKASFEEKFTNMYAELTVNVFCRKFFIDQSKKKEKNQSCPYNKKHLENFLRAIVSAHKHNTEDLADKRDDFVLCSMFRKEIVHNAFVKETRDMCPLDEKYKDNEMDTPVQRSVKEHNRMQHVKGCCLFITYIYTQGTDKEHTLVGENTICSLCMNLINMQYKEMLEKLGRDVSSDSIKYWVNKQYKEIREQANNELQKLRSCIADCVRQKIKLEGTPLWILAKVLETAINKLRNEMDRDLFYYIKNCAQSFPDEIIPSYTYYKFQEWFTPFKKQAKGTISAV